MDKSKKIILLAIAVVIVLIGIIFVIIYNSKILIFSDNYFGFLKSIQPITTVTKTVPTSTANPRAFDAKINIPLYVDMIAKFGGNRFQFSSDCTSVTPYSLVIKGGSQFMIDNRDSKAHVFHFSGKKYKVSGYGYAIVTTSKIGNQSVFCDSVQRVTVNVQK